MEPFCTADVVTTNSKPEGWLGTPSPISLTPIARNLYWVYGCSSEIFADIFTVVSLGAMITVNIRIQKITRLIGLIYEIAYDSLEYADIRCYGNTQDNLWIFFNTSLIPLSVNYKKLMD